MPVPAARSSRLFELGRLTSELRAAPPEAAERRLTEVAGVDDRAGRDLLAYLEPGGRDGCACSAPGGSC